MIRVISAAAVAAFLAIAVFSGWAAMPVSSGATGAPMKLPPDREALVIETDGESVSFTVEIADSEDERSRGLMFRRDLPTDRGMLFVFEETARRGFWMQNTPLPLDLLFVAESGRIVAIRQGKPLSEEIIAPIYPIRFVLELHEGTARKNNIRIGSRMRHRIIDQISGLQ